MLGQAGLNLRLYGENGQLFGDAQERVTFWVPESGIFCAPGEEFAQGTIGNATPLYLMTPYLSSYNQNSKFRKKKKNLSKKHDVNVNSSNSHKNQTKK